MKKAILAICFLFLVFAANAQKNQKQFNAGLGFAPDVIPIYIGFDYWVHEDISIGGEIAWRRNSWTESGNAYYETTWNFNFNSNYHFSRIFEIPNKFDPYLGLNIGFYHYQDNVDYTSYESHTSGLGLGGQLGFRYYFSEAFAAGIEFTGGNRVSNGKIGVSIKF